MFLLRCPATHDYHCSLLTGPLADNDSITYGINSKSILNTLDYFHVADNQLPQDVMHVLLEGVVPQALKLLLNSFIYVKKYFSLDFLNDRIQCFNYSRTERRDKPSLILARMLNLDGKISQSGRCAYSV